MSHANERIITYSVVGSFRLWPIPFKNSCLANCPELRASTDLWRAGLPRAGRRSRPNSLTQLRQIHRGGWFWGCVAAQRRTSPLATGGGTAGFSWRAGLPRAGRQSRPNSLTPFCQIYRGGCFRGCCAVQRGTPSPQVGIGQHVSRRVAMQPVGRRLMPGLVRIIKPQSVHHTSRVSL